MLENLATEMEALKKEVEELKHKVVMDFTNHILAQQKQISSRKGDPGQSIVGPAGPAGRDAVLIVETDTGTNTIHVFDETGAEKAVLVAIPGPAGKDAPSPRDPRDGRDGKDGRNAPSLAEIVTEVVKVIEKRLVAN